MIGRLLVRRPQVFLHRQQQRCLSTLYETKRLEAGKRLLEVEEVKQRDKFEATLPTLVKPAAAAAITNTSLTKDNVEEVLKAGFATFLIHVEGRIASFIGEGFYTIGPCGEELMAVLGILARDTDPMALHYRHVAVQVARQLKRRSMEEVVLDRARAYVCSTLDPVTGAHHCAIGGGPFDFYVTSTLASQAPPAVGRALGIKLAPRLAKDGAKFPPDSVSIVSVGDGSVNNGMFLSALNLSKYSAFRGFKCPVLFVITNNDLCISLKGYGYIKHFVETSGLPIFRAPGSGDLDKLYVTTEKALASVRQDCRPAILVVDELPRRFGHAATDRQLMYLEADEIEKAANSNPLEAACAQALSLGLVDSPETLLTWWLDIRATVEKSFIVASQEPKITSREEVLGATKAPYNTDKVVVRPNKNRKRRPQPMRVLMNETFEEALANIPECVYIGEDVRHGGYYRVTDKLAEMFPLRVQDVPPDETSVMGIAMGYSQSGLVPIAEIPYAKYLDCAADMFFEIIMTHWCTKGNQKDGMLIRLQGFDKGVFGGNFHTHNMLYTPPGIDVVCFSNGRDYCRGIRHAIHQVQTAGRVIMSVDSTDLLHRRDLHQEKDSKWLHNFPDDDVVLNFDTVVCYSNPDDPHDYQYVEEPGSETPSNKELLIFSYGNGVPTALRAASQIKDKSVAVVDCPNLSNLNGSGLQTVLKANPQATLIFADVCKAGQHPFGSLVFDLQDELQSRSWHCVAASPTYNPLGCTVTFLSESDILEKCQ